MEKSLGKMQEERKIKFEKRYEEVFGKKMYKEDDSKKNPEGFALNYYGIKSNLV